MRSVTHWQKPSIYHTSARELKAFLRILFCLPLKIRRCITYNICPPLFTLFTSPDKASKQQYSRSTFVYGQITCITNTRSMAATGIKFLKGLNSATGLVSFSTLIGMLIRGNCKPSRSFQSYVHMMVYFDCAAFVVAFTVQFAEDSLSRCASEAFWLVASFFWSAKDAFKYGYLAFRCIRIMGFKSNIWNWAIHGAFTSSLVLYWLYMALSFNFSGTCADVSNGNVNFNWPVLLLYGWWLTMDLVMAVGMLCSLNRMSKEAKENRESLGKKDQHSPVIAQERIRLIINAIVMVILNLVSILNVTKTINVSANAIAFVYLQHWIALSSNPSSTLNMKGKNRTSSSLGSASTTTGGTASGKSRAKQQLGMLAAAHGANEMAEK